jgi:predicted metal-binding transcription factor (methanogenesis marker protein 9)
MSFPLDCSWQSKAGNPLYMHQYYIRKKSVSSEEREKLKRHFTLKIVTESKMGNKKTLFRGLHFI